MVALGVLLIVIVGWMCIFNYYISPTPEEWRFIHPLVGVAFALLICWEVAKAIRRQRRGEVVLKRTPLPLKQRLIAVAVIVIVFAVLILLVLYLGGMI